MKAPPGKLDALTSARFIAALLIVLHHTGHSFGIDYGNFPLDWGCLSFSFYLGLF